jgi:hypothetical protein
LGVGLLGLFGLDLALISWLIGVVLGIIVAGATILLNIQKWVIIFITSFAGAGVIIGTLLMVLGKIAPSDFGTNAVRLAIQDSFLWAVFYLALAGLGFVAQYISTRTFVLEEPQSSF